MRFAPRAHATALVAVTVLFVAVRIWIAFVRPENSDESQHLHVAWAIAHGAVPYRDVFDNHAPLGALLYAPIVAAVGERADIVAVMRLAMIPWSVASLLLVIYIGRRLWSPRVGACAAAIAATAPVVAGTSVEFRPDVLWATAWLAVIAALVAPMPLLRRSALAGALLGVAFAVSLKTVLLAVCAALAGAAVASGAKRLRLASRAAAAGAVSALAAFCVVGAYPFAMGAARAAAYCLVTHNVVAGLGRGRPVPFAAVALALGVASSLVLLRGYARRRAHDTRSLWRAFVVASAALYVACLYGAWPLVTHQDLLPAAPLLALGIAASILRPADGHLGAALRAALAFAIVAVCAASLVTSLFDSASKLRYAEARRERALRLAGSDTPVMDAKGFTVFRRRPIYWVFESVTQRRMREGSIADTTPASLAATATPVVIGDHLPAGDRTFVRDNYLCTDDGVLVAGQRILPDASGVRQFRVAIPLPYEVVGENGAEAAVIDGRAVDGAVELDAGMHTLAASGGSPLYLVWAESLRRSPRKLVVGEFSGCWHDAAS